TSTPAVIARYPHAPPRCIARAGRVRRVSKVRVDIWADIACPWCYIGKRQLDRALGRFAHRDRVEIAWRAFELDPLAPRAVEQARLVGLDDAEVGEVLGGERYAVEVRRDESIARGLGVDAVPFYVFGGRFAVSGAQPMEVLGGALERGWAELRIPEPVPAEP